MFHEPLARTLTVMGEVYNCQEEVRFHGISTVANSSCTSIVCAVSHDKDAIERPSMSTAVVSPASPYIRLSRIFGLDLALCAGANILGYALLTLCVSCPDKGCIE
jgi:hypothetical protein